MCFQQIVKSATYLSDANTLHTFYILRLCEYSCLLCHVSFNFCIIRINVLSEHTQIRSQSGSTDFELHAPFCLRSEIRTVIVLNVNKINKKKQKKL